MAWSWFFFIGRRDGGSSDGQDIADEAAGSARSSEEERAGTDDILTTITTTTTTEDAVVQLTPTTETASESANVTPSIPTDPEEHRHSPRPRPPRGEDGGISFHPHHVPSHWTALVFTPLGVVCGLLLLMVIVRWVKTAKSRRAACTGSPSNECIHTTTAMYVARNDPMVRQAPISYLGVDHEASPESVALIARSFKLIDSERGHIKLLYDEEGGTYSAVDRVNQSTRGRQSSQLSDSDKFATCIKARTQSCTHRIPCQRHHCTLARPSSHHQSSIPFETRTSTAFMINPSPLAFRRRPTPCSGTLDALHSRWASPCQQVCCR